MYNIILKCIFHAVATGPPDFSVLPARWQGYHQIPFDSLLPVFCMKLICYLGRFNDFSKDSSCLLALTYLLKHLKLMVVASKISPKPPVFSILRKTLRLITFKSRNLTFITLCNRKFCISFVPFCILSFLRNAFFLTISFTNVYYISIFYH